MVIQMNTKSYSELIQFSNFLDRYRYLRIGGSVGKETFGLERYFNQIFYTSNEWKTIRRKVIVRDNGCDLGVRGYEIQGRVIVHHINPITLKDIEDHCDKLLDPENLITTVHNTHNAIHYGDEKLLFLEPVKRFKNDTCPWRKYG